MRLALIGSGSYIARHVKTIAEAQGVDVFSFPRDAVLNEILSGMDVAINFTLHPDYQNSNYDEANDLDLKAAQAAAKNGVRFLMLSTRRVYPTGAKWDAREDGAAGGDETVYGRNKAISEAAVRDVMGNAGVILRLSNIIGFEYERDRTRKTFMAMVLGRLRSSLEISFDMDPLTLRDFLPVEVCADGIVRIAQTQLSGVFNLGCGFGVPCGEIAQAVLKGFGKGELVVTCREIRDAFFLNMTRWNSHFAPLVAHDGLISYCEALGRRLKDA